MNEVPLNIPILTDVIAAQGLSPAQQAAVLGALPGLVQDTVACLRPQFEQQLLDALLPRVAALLSGGEADA
jgi:hypothetical protein